MFPFDDVIMLFIHALIQSQVKCDINRGIFIKDWILSFSGMLYAGMTIEVENDALIFEIWRSELMVAQNTTVKVSGEWETLQWRHNGHDSVSNHQPHDCLLNRYSGTDQRKHQSSASLAFEFFSPGFPAQRASNAENVSIWWRHHVWPKVDTVGPGFRKHCLLYWH